MITLAASKGASFLCQQTGDNSRYAVLPLHTSRHIVSRQRQVFAKCIDAGIISLLLLIINICGSVSSYMYFVYIAITEAVILTLFNK